MGFAAALTAKTASALVVMANCLNTCVIFMHLSTATKSFSIIVCYDYLSRLLIGAASDADLRHRCLLYGSRRAGHAAENLDVSIHSVGFVADTQAGC